MLRVEVVNYAEKPAAEQKEKNKPVEYIGLVAPHISDHIIGKMSLRVVLQKTQKDPSQLAFIVAEAKAKEQLIALLAEEGLNSGFRPVVHLFECYKPTDELFPKGLTQKDMQEYLSKIIQEYPATSDQAILEVEMQPAKKLDEAPTALASNSVFAKKETENKGEANVSATPGATPPGGPSFS